MMGLIDDNTFESRRIELVHSVFAYKTLVGSNCAFDLRGRA